MHDSATIYFLIRIVHEKLTFGKTEQHNKPGGRPFVTDTSAVLILTLSIQRCVTFT